MKPSTARFHMSQHIHMLIEGRGEGSAAFGEVPELNTPYNTINMELMTPLRHAAPKLIFKKLALKCDNAFRTWNIPSEWQQFIVDIWNGLHRPNALWFSYWFQWERDPETAQPVEGNEDVWWVFDWGETKWSYVCFLRRVVPVHVEHPRFGPPLRLLSHAPLRRLDGIGSAIPRRHSSQRSHKWQRPWLWPVNNPSITGTPTDPSASLHSSHPPKASLRLMWTRGRVSVSSSVSPSRDLGRVWSPPFTLKPFVPPGICTGLRTATRLLHDGDSSPLLKSVHLKKPFVHFLLNYLPFHWHLADSLILSDILKVFHCQTFCISIIITIFKSGVNLWPWKRLSLTR